MNIEIKLVHFIRDVGKGAATRAINSRHCHGRVGRTNDDPAMRAKYIRHKVSIPVALKEKDVTC